MCTYMHGRDDTHREFQYTIPWRKKLYKLLFHASVFVDYRLFGKHQKNV